SLEGGEVNLALSPAEGSVTLPAFHINDLRPLPFSRFQALRRKVTGPSLTRLTTIWAPKRPVSTLPGSCRPQASTSWLNTRSASAGGAAVLKLGRIPESVSAASVNWLTSSRPPPESSRERFILPASSAKTR